MFKTTPGLCNHLPPPTLLLSDPYTDLNKRQNQDGLLLLVLQSELGPRLLIHFWVHLNAS